MKKGISLLLVLTMLLTLLCACSQQTSNNENSGSLADILGNGTGKKETVSRGEVKKEDYVNDSIDVKFTLADASWRFYSDEELANLMNISVDTFLKVDINADSLTQLIDFCAIQDSTGCTVNLSIEPLSRLGNSDITLEEYIQLTKTQLEAITVYKYTFGEQKNVTLGDHKYLRVEIEMSYSGMIIAQYMYIRKVGDYMIAINTAGAKGTMTAEAFEKMFS